MRFLRRMGAGKGPRVSFVCDTKNGFAFKRNGPDSPEGPVCEAEYKAQAGSLPKIGRLEVSCNGNQYTVKLDARVVLEYTAAESNDCQGLSLGGGGDTLYTITHLQVTGKLDPRWLAKALAGAGEPPGK